MSQMTADPIHYSNPYATHTVTNQAAPRTGINEFSSNQALVEAVSRYAPNADTAELNRIGELIGTEKFQEAARVAHVQTPTHSTHDRWGNRVDAVEFHPSYHYVIEESYVAAVHSHAWVNPGPGANVDRAARMMMFAQVEPGHTCPVGMTGSAVATVMNSGHADFWLPRLLSNSYDPRLIDPAEKSSVQMGMAMTEKQGGSDVRANTTFATPMGGSDNTLYRITGHKWFCSAPQSDAFLVLATLPEGVTCFLVPRILPGGERNGFFVQRLKNKLGNKSNASSEIELNDAVGWIVGEPGRGVRTIIEMVHRTRLDCILGSTAGMRQSVAEAAWHVRSRSAFGARLFDKPLMRAVIADLQLESEAATWTSAHLTRQHDDESTDAVNFRRLATAVAKYWICKRGPGHSYEALECLGGNGYTEDFPLAMRYREQPVNAVWEGSGNVIVLDVLRSITREPASVKSFLAFLEQGIGRYAEFDAAYAQLSSDLTRAESILSSADDGQKARLERSSRSLVEQMALLLQASVLMQSAPAEVATAYVLSRLGSQSRQEYGALPDAADIDFLAARA